MTARTTRHSPPIWLRSRVPSRGRLATLRRLIVALRLRTGREPTDLELARALACPPGSIQRYRKRLGAQLGS
jgi:hypothetical protein